MMTGDGITFPNHFFGGSDRDSYDGCILSSSLSSQIVQHSSLPSPHLLPSHSLL